LCFRDDPGRQAWPPNEAPRRAFPPHSPPLQERACSRELVMPQELCTTHRARRLLSKLQAASAGENVPLISELRVRGQWKTATP
jgi:hypothetical protein